MKCPFCGVEDSKVIDSRPTDEGARIRRRRECLSCAKRFTTYEIVESVPLVVVKKDGSRELFDRGKLMSGMVRACQKRGRNDGASDIVVGCRRARRKTYRV